MGPFNNWLSQRVARYILNKVDLIALRDRRSFEYVKSLSLKKPRIILAADLAYLLKPISPEKTHNLLEELGIKHEQKPLIAIVLNLYNYIRIGGTKSKKKSEKKEEYIHLMVQLSEYLINKLSANVLFLNHVYGNTQADEDLYARIYEQISNKQRIFYLNKKYLADELKGILGCCDIVIGSWMHSTIAATSMGVPTIAIAFSDKFYRVFGEMMKQDDFIVDIRNHEPEKILNELQAKVSKLWAIREQVKDTLKKLDIEMQGRARLYGQLIAEKVRKDEA